MKHLLLFYLLCLFHIICKSQNEIEPNNDFIDQQYESIDYKMKMPGYIEFVVDDRMLGNVDDALSDLF